MRRDRDQWRQQVVGRAQSASRDLGRADIGTCCSHPATATAPPEHCLLRNKLHGTEGATVQQVLVMIQSRAATGNGQQAAAGRDLWPLVEGALQVDLHASFAQSASGCPIRAILPEPHLISTLYAPIQFARTLCGRRDCNKAAADHLLPTGRPLAKSPAELIRRPEMWPEPVKQLSSGRVTFC